MIGHRAIAGVSLLCGLVFCVFGVSSAAAEGTEAFACQKVGLSKGAFHDAHCDTEEAGGTYKHEPLPENPAAVVITNAETESETTKAAHATLKGVLGGIASEITCNAVTGTGTVENKAGTPKTVNGTGTAEYTQCTMPKPVTGEGKERCKIKEPIKFEATSTTKEKGAEMGVLFSPKEGKTFVSLSFENGPGGGCPVAGKSAPVTGTVEGTPGGTSEGHGATLVFTTAMTKGTKCETAEQKGLCLGGQAAEFSSTITTATTVTDQAEEAAVVLTTG
jgi:hypothetical protein